MAEDTCPVRWTGRQAVVTLPECIDVSNACCAREQLLLAINRGAAVLIADLAATVSCDYAGTDALMRAYQRAAANGTDLRLVVIGDVVRRVPALSGLDRLVSVYPTLEAAVAAGAEYGDGRDEPTTAATIADRVRAAVARADCAEQLLDRAVTTIFTVGLSLQATVGLPRGPAAQRITDALGRLDDVVREVRDHRFAGYGEPAQPGLAWRPPPDLDEHFARTASRTASLHQRVTQTARAVESAAAETAGLLEQRADLVGQPARVDYRTDSKWWRVIADQAAELAERWENRR
jgi:anti-sigma B factor antagonist